MADAQQIDDLKAKMREQRDKLLAMLEVLSDEEAERSTSGEGQWSAKQQMSHLCEMETMYRAWVQKALEEDGANVDRLAGEPPAIPLEQAHTRSLADHVAEMRRQRGLTDELIAAIAPGDFERRAENRLFGSLTVMQWLRSYYRHDRMHVDQVQGQDSTYKPQYAGGREPDQRRG